MKKLKYLQSKPNIFMIILITLISCQNNNNSFQTLSDVNSSNLNVMEGQSGLVSFDNYSVFIAQGDKTVAEIAKSLGINKNILSGYLTDVMISEPMKKDHPFIKNSKILITPHIGSRTYQTVQRQGLKSIENLVNNI